MSSDNLNSCPYPNSSLNGNRSVPKLNISTEKLNSLNNISSNSISTPGVSTPNSHLDTSPSSSDLNLKFHDMSLHNNRRAINPAVQAKLLAFQEKRKQQQAAFPNNDQQTQSPTQNLDNPYSSFLPSNSILSSPSSTSASPIVSSNPSPLIEKEKPLPPLPNNNNSDNTLVPDTNNPEITNSNDGGIIRRTSFRLPKKTTPTDTGLTPVTASNMVNSTSNSTSNSASSNNSSMVSTPINSSLSTPTEPPLTIAGLSSHTKTNQDANEATSSSNVSTINASPSSNAATFSSNTNINSTGLTPKDLNSMKAAILSQSQSPVSTELPKRSTLSQRRGMKLNINSLMNNAPQTTPPSTDPTNATTGERPKIPVMPMSMPNFPKAEGTHFGNSNLMAQKRTPTKMDRLKKGMLPQRGSMQPSHPPPVPPVPSQVANSNSIIKPGGMFASYAKYIDIKSGSLNFKGKASLHAKGIDFSNGSSFRISQDELEIQDELGRGNYGIVSKVLHKPTGIIMAMKEVRLELDDSKFRQILMELEVLHNCNSDCIVDFYGAFFVEGAVYMCIEYMGGGSLDKLYFDGIPEQELAYITKRVVTGLQELKDKHNIIHRDVKPTNILANEHGKVKLTDFGVSGNLIASLARTNIGCQSYMAPERIKSNSPDVATYTVSSDIWSLGLSILEIANGCYPYPAETYDNIFSQLSAIVDGDPPILPKNKFSTEAQDFVAQCLNKVPSERPGYAELLKHPWMLKYPDESEGQAKMEQLVQKVLKSEHHHSDKKVPALHKKQFS